MMALKAIDQQIFDWIYTVADGLGFDVYDFLPQYEVAYPFVVIGEVQVVPRQVKHRTLGTLHVRLDLWAEQESRRQISDMTEDLMERLSGWAELDSRWVKMAISNSTKRLLSDTSTDKPLWHGVLDLEFNIY